MLADFPGRLALDLVRGVLAGGIRAVAGKLAQTATVLKVRLAR